MSTILNVQTEMLILIVDEFQWYLKFYIFDLQRKLQTNKIK